MASRNQPSSVDTESIAVIFNMVKNLTKNFEDFKEENSKDFEDIKERMKDQQSFLEKEVSHALNGQKEVKLQISQLKSIQDSCPVKRVEEKLKKITEETEESRVSHKYPEIRRSLQINNIVTVASSLVAAASAIVLLIIALKTF